MKCNLPMVVIPAFLLFASSCKKSPQSLPQLVNTQPQNHSLEKGLVNFSIKDELLGSVIDTTSNTITVVIPNSANQRQLHVTVALASQVSCTLNGTPITGTMTYDFTQSANLKVTSANGQFSTTFKVDIETQTYFEGFGGSTITAQNSLNRDYNFYFDQFDGSQYQSSNCGPAISSMAIKWADSTFAGTPAYARSLVEPQGGAWTTADVQSYLSSNNINTTVDTLVNIDSLVKTNIDHGNILIFCVNMLGVPFNPNPYQHVAKFYGPECVYHYIMAKGYREVNGKFYIDFYDPYSQGVHYPGYDYAQIKGKDRFYIDTDANDAANYWPYAIAVAPKGQKTYSSTKKGPHARRLPKPFVVRA